MFETPNLFRQFHSSTYVGFEPFPFPLKPIFSLIRPLYQGCNFFGILFTRISFSERSPSPSSQPKLGWSSLWTGPTGSLRLLSWQTGSHTSFRQSRQLLRPRLCPRSRGALGWRNQGWEFYSLRYTGREKWEEKWTSFCHSWLVSIPGFPWWGSVGWNGHAHLVDWNELSYSITAFGENTD